MAGKVGPFTRSMAAEEAVTGQRRPMGKVDRNIMEEAAVAGQRGPMKKGVLKGGQRKKKGSNADMLPTTRRKTEEAVAADCSVGEKAADAALVGIVAEERPVADAAGDEIIYVMSQEQIDYILSWDLKEDKFHRCDDDSDAWNEACDFFRKAELERMEYQKQVREEYETYGYVRVEYDEEEEKRMSERHEAAFLKAFGPDFHLDNSDSEDEVPEVIVQGA